MLVGVSGAGIALGSTGSPEFEPLGDEHRLLIVVREGRP
jgi:hypothetical protein